MWLIIGIIYFIVIMALTKLSDRLEKRMNKNEPTRSGGCGRRTRRHREDGIEGLKKSFGKLDVLKGIDTTVSQGEVVCVIGPSGSGKSSIFALSGTSWRKNSRM